MSCFCEAVLPEIDHRQLNATVVLERNFHELLHEALERTNAAGERQNDVNDLLVGRLGKSLDLNRLQRGERPHDDNLRGAVVIMVRRRWRRVCLVVRLFGAKVKLVLRARHGLVPINSLDEVVQGVALVRSRGILIEGFQRSIERVEQIFALVADGLLDDPFAEAQIDRIDAAKREVIERN